MDVVWSPPFPYIEYRDEEIWNRLNRNGYVFDQIATRQVSPRSRCHVDPRRRSRAGSYEFDGRGDRGDRGQNKMGSAGGGRECIPALWNSGARRAYRVAAPHAGRAQGAARDAGRGGMALD